MTLQDLASLAEIISSIAVIATLIFVGLQIRQSNILLQRGEETVTMAEWSRIRLSIIEEYLWAAYHIWDRTRRDLFLHGRFDETMQVLRFYLNNPHGIKWWGETKVTYPQPFVRDVEAILSGST